MSVTFRPAYSDGDLVGYGFECYSALVDGEPVSHVYGNRADADAGFASHTALCSECRFYSHVYPVSREMPSVNMANGNAAFILSLLGIPFEDGSGVADAVEFAARVEFALVVGGGDAGTTDVAYRTDGGATVVECGRSPGYADERLAQLVEVARWALDNDHEVAWS